MNRCSQRVIITMKKIDSHLSPNSNKLNIVSIYLTVCIFFLILVVLISAKDHGRMMSSFFFYDKIDTGMDFFNSLAEASGRDPYQVYNTLYPPLANLFFYLLSLFVPVDFFSNIPKNHMEIIGLRGTPYDFRLQQSIQILFILYNVIAFTLLVFTINRFLRTIKGHYMITACLALSPCVIYTLERGNIILLAFVCVMVFLMNYQSKDRRLRELAYISLAIAAGLKLYPAVFGVLIIREKRYKEAIRTAIYGIITIFVPFLFFNGFNDFKVMISSIGSQLVDEGMKTSGYGWENIRAEIISFLQHVFGISGSVLQNDMINTILKAVVLILLIVLIIKEKALWKSTLGCVIIILLYQFSYEYTLIFFIASFTLFLVTDNKATKANVFYFAYYLILLVPYPSRIRFDNNLERIRIIQFTIIVLTLFYIVDGIRSIIKVNKHYPNPRNHNTYEL